jgi:hypothetical protein
MKLPVSLRYLYPTVNNLAKISYFIIIITIIINIFITVRRGTNRHQTFWSVKKSLGQPGLRAVDVRVTLIILLLLIIIIIQFFIIYVTSQQLQGQLQTQHSVDTSNYITGEHNLKSKSNER